MLVYSCPRAQKTLFKSKYPEGNNLLLQFKAGAGLPFAGFSGIGNEWRTPYWSLYYAMGYMYAYTYNHKYINESINFGGGLRWYLLHPNYATRIRLGIHGGWLNNYYYHEDPYKPTVYGMALSAGLLWQKGYFSLGFDVMFDPGMAIINPSTHPDYSSHYYWSPSLDVGINLAKFYVTPFRFNKYNNVRRDNRNSILGKKNSKISTDMLINSCIGEKKQSSEGYFYKFNEFYYIVIPFTEKQKIIISISKDSISLKPNICNKFRVSKNNLPIKIKLESDVIIDNGMLDQNLKTYIAKDGIIHIYFQKPILRFSRDKFKMFHVRITDMVFVNEDQQQIDEIIIDEIVLYDIPFQKHFQMN